MQYDITILTEDRYWRPEKMNRYISNILEEDGLLQLYLEEAGLRCQRLSWSDPSFDWTNTRTAIFRTTWDYFDHFHAFQNWLNKVKSKTFLINSYELIQWNLDKHYLLDLEKKGVAIPPTQFIEKGDKRSLKEWQHILGWDPFILKPAVSGAGRHTYKLSQGILHQKEELYRRLINEEHFLIQEFMPSVPEKGEVSFMMVDGAFTHAILKKAKAGDFRVQDDFGGTIHDYQASSEEIEWAEWVFHTPDENAVYGRVDAIWNNDNTLCLSELELIEPEMWFRKNKKAAQKLAKACASVITAL